MPGVSDVFLRPAVLSIRRLSGFIYFHPKKILKKAIVLNEGAIRKSQFQKCAARRKGLATPGLNLPVLFIKTVLNNTRRIYIELRFTIFLFLINKREIDFNFVW